MSIRSFQDARRLDQRITIQRRVAAQGSTGAMSHTWSDVVTTWAAVDGEKAGGERYVQNGVRSVSDYTFWIRADIKSRFSIDTTHRIVWDGRYFDIADMPDQQLRGRFLAIIGRAGVNVG